MYVLGSGWLWCFKLVGTKLAIFHHLNKYPGRICCIFWIDIGVRSQTTLTRFWLFLTTYPPQLTFSMVWMLTKSGYFWTTYLSTSYCKRNLWTTPSVKYMKFSKFDFSKSISKMENQFMVSENDFSFTQLDWVHNFYNFFLSSFRV